MSEKINGIEEFKKKLINHVTSLKDDNDIRDVLTEAIDEVEFIKIDTFDDFEERVSTLILYKSDFEDEEEAKEYLKKNNQAVYQTSLYTERFSSQPTSASDLASSLEYCRLQKLWQKEAGAFKQMFKPLFLESYKK